MKEKWLNTPFSYRVVMLFHAALMLLFILLYATLGRQQVVRHEDGIFVQRQDGNTLTYAGKLNGEKAVLTVLPDGSLECLLDGVRHGPHTVTEDPSAIPETIADSNFPRTLLIGIEIREGDEVLFRGGFHSTGDFFFFYNSDGTQYVPSTERVTTPTTNGSVLSIEPVEPSLKTILRFTLAREIVPRSTVGSLLLGLFCSVACILSAFFAEELFRHNLRFSIKNVENAEPSEWELMSRWISWIALSAVSLATYISGLSSPILS